MTQPTNTPAAALDDALTALATDMKAKGVPHRYDARAILVPLGQLMIAAREADGVTDPGGDWVERIQKLVEPVMEFWQAAVQEELSLSCSEHIRAVDPRFLDHPGYDFPYTLTARARLEARLLGCQALDLEVPEGLLDRVVEADARLAPYLDSKS